MNSFSSRLARLESRSAFALVNRSPPLVYEIVVRSHFEAVAIQKLEGLGWLSGLFDRVVPADGKAYIAADLLRLDQARP